VTSAAAVWSLAHSIVVLLLFGAKYEIRFTIYKRGANYSELSSSRDYPEGSDRLEVRVPSWESHRKVRDPREEVQSFSSEDFHRNCETVTLSVVLQQYSTTTQYRAAQSDKVRDGPNYSSSTVPAVLVVLEPEFRQD
jgi:hypothetical protein